MENFAIVETILRNRHGFFASIRDSEDLPKKIKAMLISCFVFLAIYGAVMGMTHSPLQVLSSAIKLPFLFLVTLIICAPSLYIFNLLFGSKQTLPQNVALILTAMTTTAVLLLSFAPITVFFVLTSQHYDFFKLLNVVFFAIAAFTGVSFLRLGMFTITDATTKEGSQARRVIFSLWVVLYAFVGSQMAWTLSPFIGQPGEPYIVFSRFGGNFYSDVIATIGRLLMR
jgi:hypothetical protein